MSTPIVQIPRLTRFKYVHLLLLSCMLSGSAAAATPTVESKLEKSQAGFYRMKVGTIDVTALSDGTLGFEVLDLLTNAKPGEVERLLAKAYVKSPVEASINVFLIQLDGRLILVDTGTGALLGPKLGKLPRSLEAAGFRADQVTDVVVTHIHPDHTGGLTDGDRKVFPNAVVHVNRKELDYWTDPSTGEKSPEPTKSFFQQVEKSLKPYVASGRVRTFEGETELFPGFRTLPAYGHTPGMTYYVLESRRERLEFWGDTIHVPDVQFEDPAITIKFDVDSKQAAIQRRKAFADAVKQGYLVALPHMYFPGVGHVQKDGAHYRWIPVPYTNDAIPEATATRAVQSQRGKPNE